MKNASHQIIAVFILLAAGALFGNYQSPVAVDHAWPTPIHVPGEATASPSALFVYDSEGVLASIAVADPDSPFVHVLEPLACEAAPAFHALQILQSTAPPTSGFTLALTADTIQFQGREYDAETGLYYFRHRYYDPELGRFTQTDPMGYADSMNLYQAFGQSPQNFGDPMGLCLGLNDEPCASYLPYYESGYLYQGHMKASAAYQNPNKSAVGKAGAYAADLILFLPGWAEEYGVRPLLNLPHSVVQNIDVANAQTGEGIAAGDTEAALRGTGGYFAAFLEAGAALIPFNKDVQLATESIGPRISGLWQRINKIGGRRAPPAPTTSNAEIVQEIATRAESWGERQGLPGAGGGSRQGTLKHDYAKQLLDRYQSMFGDRGLLTERSWLGGSPVEYGTKGSVRLDVFDINSNFVYDYKFTLEPRIGPLRVQQITNQGPPGITGVLPVGP